ncbi:MAG: MarR family transcriptional regulator [Pseudomonadota bacterium]
MIEDTEIDIATDADRDEVFAFFTEVGIVNQLSTALLTKALPDGVHPSHFAILNHLTKRGDGRTPVAIAAAMQVTKTTMTHSLKVLEGRGFISVRANPDDGRGKLVYLTEAGQRFRTGAIDRVIEMFGRILTPEIRAVMAQALPQMRRVRTHLDANRAD